MSTPRTADIKGVIRVHRLLVRPRRNPQEQRRDKGAHDFLWEIDNFHTFKKYLWGFKGGPNLKVKGPCFSKNVGLCATRGCWGPNKPITPPRKPTDGTPVFHGCLHQAQSDKSRRGEVLPAMICSVPRA